MTELAGIAGSTPANVDARYRRGVAAVLDGLLVNRTTDDEDHLDLDR